MKIHDLIAISETRETRKYQRDVESSTYNAVSPGAVHTNFDRNMPWMMQKMMAFTMPILGPLFGMMGPVGPAARRYLDAAEFGDEISGRFYASPPKRLVGTLQEQADVHFADERKQEAAWNVITNFTGVSYPDVAIAT